jgi:hypothetical protein
LNRSYFSIILKYVYPILPKVKLIIISLFICFIITCQKNPALDQETVLRVDNQSITLSTFRDYYELDPGFPSYRKGEVGLREYAEQIADKILSAKLAREKGLLDSIPYRKAIKYERKKAVIRQFYLSEVAEKIKIDEKELKEIYTLLGIKLVLKHLFTPEESNAFDLYQSLEAGIHFDSLATQVFYGIDSMRGGADLGEAHWGELEPNLERAAFELKSGEYSKPIESKWGYHILYLSAREKIYSYSETDYQKNRRRILSKVKRKKEEIAAGEYLKNYLDPFQIKVKSEAFYKIISILGIYDENRPKIQFQRFDYMTDQQIDILRTSLKKSLNEPFMTSTIENWSIKDFLLKLSELPLKARPQISNVDKFRDDIGILIRNEFLFPRASKMGFLESEKVDSLTEEFIRNIAYSHYLKNANLAYRIPLNVQQYYRNSSQNKSGLSEMPSQVLPGMQYLDDFRLYYSTRELHHSLLKQFSDTEILINDVLIKEESKRINWDNPVRMIVVPQN